MANEGIITLNDLQTKFRAAGVYTIYRDLTAVPAIRSTPILRLIVGSSRQGIFNVPVYIEQGDTTTAESLFGRLDKSLERKGSFFHRAVFNSLEEGPVLALNLLKLNNEVDQNGVPTSNSDLVPYKSFSVDVADANSVNTDKLFSSYYDKERFWKPSAAYLLATRDNTDKDSILNITNLSQSPLSFIIRKSLVKGFDVTVKEWYADERNQVPPAYTRDHDLISDYFIDVIVVRGNFGPDQYNRLSTDPIMGKFFDVDGLIVSEIDSFLARPEVGVVDTYTGSLIANFRDKVGVSQYIETIINRDTRITGVLIAVDRKELDKFENKTNTKFLDLVGHRLLTENVVDTDFLSYKKKIKEDLLYTKDIINLQDFLDNDSGITVTPDPVNQKITVVIQNSNPTFAQIDTNVKLGTLFLGETTVAGTAAGITISNPVLKVSRILNTPTQITFDVTSPLKDGETGTSGTFVNLLTAAPISEVLATAEYTITGGGDFQQAGIAEYTITNAGSGTDVANAYIDKGSGPILIGTYIIAGGDTDTQVAEGLKTDINTGTGTHGFAASNTLGVIEIVAALADGDLSNTYVPSITIVGSNGATATSDPLFTGGVTASVVEARVNDGTTNILLGSYTFQSADTPTLIAAGLDSAINALTGTHGYTSSPSSAVIAVTAGSGTGATPNTYVPNIDVSVGTTPITATQDSLFTGGVTAVGNHYTYEIDNNNFFHDGTSTWSIAEPDSQIYKDFKNGIITNGDKITDNSIIHFIKGVFTNSTTDFRDILKIEYFTDTDLVVPISSGAVVDFALSYDSAGFAVLGTNDLNYISVIGSLNERFDITEFIDQKTVKIPIANEPDFKINQYLVGKDANDDLILTRIITVVRDGSPIPTHILVGTAEAIKPFVTTGGGQQVERYLPLTSFFDRFNITHLKGFTITEAHLPNNTNERMKEIQSVMTDTNLFDALTDPEMIDFRYYIDTFNHGLETQSKRHISRLCLTRQRCMGLLNTPNIQEFRDSASPRFTDTPTAADPLPTLNIGFINQGGNLAESPDFLYTLPEEEDGASHVGFFFPNITVRDDDGDVQFVPPAAFVGNKFMQKYRGGNPFLPVAGPRRGILTGNGLVGVEYDLTKADRGLLEEKGINPIYQKRNGDIQIMGNETAFKRFNSVLNNLNTRDTLITLTIDIENILDNFTFEFNSDTLKTEITSLLNNYLSSIQNGFGAIVDFDIVFDRNNNPSFVIRENAAIVDVIVEPADVVKKFINRITLKKDSTPSVGGFLSV